MKTTWNSEKRSAIVSLFESGLDDAGIADVMGTTAASARTARCRLGLVRVRGGKPAARRTKRPCMCCREPFMSEGSHNRLCGRCREMAADSVGMDDYGYSA